MTATRADRRHHARRRRRLRLLGGAALTALLATGLAAGPVPFREAPAHAAGTFVELDRRVLTRHVVGPGGTHVLRLPVPAAATSVKLSVTGQLAWRPTKVSACPGDRATRACLADPAMTTPTRRAKNTHVTVDLRGADREVALHSSAASVSLTVRVVGYTVDGATPRPTSTGKPTAAPTPSRTSTPAPTATRAPAPAPTATRAPAPAPTPTRAPAPAPSPTRTATPAPAPSAPASRPPAGTPGPDTTGVPAGTRLTVHEGDMRITKAGTVVDSMDIRGIVRVEAPNVTIRRSVISGRPSDTSVGLVMVLEGARNVTIEDSELYSKHRSPNVRGVIGQSFTMTRVEVHSVTDQLMVTGGDVLVQDSWLHGNLHWENDPNFGGGPTHDDNVQIAAGSNIRLLRNVLEDTRNAAVMVTQDRGAVRGLELRGNRIGGGGCSVNLAEKSHGPLSGTVLADNTFERDQVHKGCAIIADAGTIPLLQMRGNRWADGAATTVTQRGS
ncbi:hypothetical protein [Cellulomonas sp. JZ18]|uniref:hypothetical protein n=1 Tax=Cellulomonas sp. JZ18 TaxID=2654191 RepID=UPI0018AF727B|nr:hypothetical protein [Cellulomonas sp. JZ18]